MPKFPGFAHKKARYVILNKPVSYFERPTGKESRSDMQEKGDRKYLENPGIDRVTSHMLNEGYTTFKSVLDVHSAICEKARFSVILKKIGVLF